MLLLGLTMAAVTLGFNLYLEVPRNHDINGYDYYYILHIVKHPSFIGVLIVCSSCSCCSSNCMLFKNNKTMFTIVENCVASLPDREQNILRYFTSEAFALPLLLAEV